MRTLLTTLLILVACGPALAAEDVATAAWRMRLGGDMAGAKARLEAHVAAHPDDGRAWFELARCGFLTATATRPPNLKDPQRAIEAALEADPENPRYLYWAGTIATYRGVAQAHKVTTMPGLPGQVRDAARYYRAALKADPDHHEARLALFGCYDRLPWLLGGNKRKATAELEALQERDPVYGTQAACEKHPRKTDAEQVALWEACIAAHPDRADAHARLALLLARTETDAGGLARAAAHADRARELDPEQTYPLLMLARAYGQAGRLDEAEATVQAYLDAGPPAAQARGWALEVLARIAKERGDTEREADLAAEAAKLNPAGFRPQVPVAALFDAP